MTHHRNHATVPQSGTTGPTTETQTVVTSGGKGKRTQLASTETIRLCAYRIWERAGKPSGDGIEFWLEAEQELMKGK
jgi:hypothetical protein